jgi:hypothetical protein
MNHKPKEYIAIRLWGRQMGSYDYYIQMEQQKAAEDNAPLDAIYKRHGTEHWVCVSELKPDHSFRAEYAAALKE